MSDAFVIKNGTILTMNMFEPSVEAVGVIGDRIVEVGSQRLVEDSLPRGYRTIDLGGRFCLPGLNEAHNHMIGFGTALGHVEAGFPKVHSIEEIKRNVAERARTTPPGTWIQGRGYDDNKLDERRHPTRQDFDEVAPDHPVIIVNGSGHMSVVNSLALKLAGVTRDTPDPQGGHLMHDDQGELTGLLQETAQQLVRAIIPDETVDDHVAALGRCNDAYVAAGITSSQDASSSEPEAIEAYQQAVRE
ncbi:MAG TPA: amidohydrolase family protein, partial [Nitrolancea sp.]|nr:amidohydrolase family protein [Nitrolancea sp.]